jgi:hypothetical protein
MAEVPLSHDEALDLLRKWADENRIIMNAEYLLLKARGAAKYDWNDPRPNDKSTALMLGIFGYKNVLIPGPLERPPVRSHA